MNFLLRHWRIVLGIWLLSLLWWGVPRCFDSWQLEHRQAELLRAIEQRDHKSYADLISLEYADDWHFNSEKITKTMDDVSAQFLTLKIQNANPQWKKEGREAHWSADLSLSGKAVTPIGDLMLGDEARPKSPFVFVWRKEGWGAWTWKLVVIRNPSLEIPESYVPGQLSELR